MKLKIKHIFGDLDVDKMDIQVYFEIVNEENFVLWLSSWRDIRELNQNMFELNEFRKEIKESCENYDIIVDLSSDNICDWISSNSRDY